MNNIENKINALPELYQPVYGHPELSTSSSRTCVDRLADIVTIYRAMELALGRPLKVLDLGCAQGFFSLNLAALGADVLGVDFEPANIDLCNELSALNPALVCRFELGDVIEVITRIEPGEFDLVLGLSVFHHVVHFNSIAHVQRHLGLLLWKVNAFVAELALREEPLYWAQSLPEEPRELLKEAAFVHQIAKHSTHLADVPRPLYFASNTHWYLDGVAETFDHWTTEPHALAEGTHEGARRYYFSDDKIIKLFRQVGDNSARHVAELTRESNFLAAPPPGFSAPHLHLHGRNHAEIWLVSERLSGKVLLDVLRDGLPVDVDKIVRTILAQLVLLEHNGLFHDDLRVWNVLVDDDSTARVIDFGSIQGAARDCVPPRNVYLSFILFVKDLVRRNVHQAAALREVIASPFGFESPYLEWMVKFWSVSPAQWSFSLLLELLDEESSVVSKDQIFEASMLWQQSVEDAVQDLRVKLVSLEKAVTERVGREKALTDKAFEQKIESVVHEVLAKSLEGLLARQVEAAVNAVPVIDVAVKEAHPAVLEKEMLRQQVEEANRVAAQLRAQLDESLSNAHHWFLRAQSNEARYNSIIQSNSWRLTAPLRALAVASKGQQNLRPLLKKVVLHGAAYTRSRPRLKRSLLVCLDAFPSVRGRLVRVIENNNRTAVVHDSDAAGLDVVLATPIPLTKRGKEIYHAFLSKSQNKDKF